MITRPLLHPAITEVNSKAALTAGGVRLSLIAWLFHIILNLFSFFVNCFQHKEKTLAL